jgi:hypothetical protein
VNPSRLRASRTLVVGAAVLVTVAMALTGCSREDDLAGDSARVGVQSLSVDEVTSRSAEVSDLAQTLGAPAIDAGELNRAQVSVWVQERLSDLAADEAGIDITQGDVDAFLKEVVAANGTTLQEFRQAVALQQGFWIPPSGLETYTKSFLQQQALGRKLAPNGSEQEQQLAAQKLLAETGDTVGVLVAPRYGTWDPETGQVLPTSDDLSAPPSDAPVVPEGLVPETPSQG